VLAKGERGHWRSLPVRAGARTVEGLIVYRFGSGLYFANAARLVADLELLTGSGSPVRWLCLDAAAIGDIDYTAGAVLQRVRTQLEASDVRLVLSNVIAPVRAQLDRYGITATYYDTSGEVLEAYLAG
jgi:SulP family sulfate permease